MAHTGRENGKRTRMRAVNPDQIEVELFATMSLRAWDEIASALLTAPNLHAHDITEFRRHIHSVTQKIRASVEADYGEDIPPALKKQAD